MSVKKVLMIVVLVVLLIVVCVLGIRVGRNFIIISELQELASERALSTNFSVVSSTTNSDGTTESLKYFQKGDKKAAIQERLVSGELMTVSMFFNGERTDMFFDTTTEKSAIIGADSPMISEKVCSNLETDNFAQKLLSSFKAKIEVTEIDGKKCYVINDSFSPNYLYEEGKNEFVIEAETGLCVKIVTDNFVTEKLFEFDLVSDDVFVEPNIGEYKIQM